MAYINMKRIVALILSIMMVMAMTCTIAFADETDDADTSPVISEEAKDKSGGGDPNDLFDKGEKLLTEIGGKIRGISTAAAAVFLAIAGCMWGFGNKQQSQAGWEWIKRILIAYIVINLATLIVETAGNLAGI